jgi:cytochrome P450 family 710 subfamily A protein
VPLLLLQVIKEVLRYRPPAPMVPQVAMKPFKLNDNYTVRGLAAVWTAVNTALHDSLIWRV